MVSSDFLYESSWEKVTRNRRCLCIAFCKDTLSTLFCRAVLLHLLNTKDRTLEFCLCLEIYLWAFCAWESHLLPDPLLEALAWCSSPSSFITVGSHISTVCWIVKWVLIPNAALIWELTVGLCSASRHSVMPDKFGAHPNQMSLLGGVWWECNFDGLKLSGLALLFLLFMAKVHMAIGIPWLLGRRDLAWGGTVFCFFNSSQ